MIHYHLEKQNCDNANSRAFYQYTTASKQIRSDTSVMWICHKLCCYLLCWSKGTNIHTWKNSYKCIAYNSCKRSNLGTRPEHETITYSYVQCSIRTLSDQLKVSINNSKCSFINRFYFVWCLHKFRCKETWLINN